MMIFETVADADVTLVSKMGSKAAGIEMLHRDVINR